MAHPPPHLPQNRPVTINGGKLGNIIDHLRAHGDQAGLADELQFEEINIVLVEKGNERRWRYQCRICEEKFEEGPMPKYRLTHRCWGVGEPDKAEDDRLLVLCLEWLVETFPESTNADALALREFVTAQSEEKTS